MSTIPIFNAEVLIPLSLIVNTRNLREIESYCQFCGCNCEKCDVVKLCEMWGSE